MKEITIKPKFDIGQDVYIISDNKAFKSEVQSIKIVLEKPAKVESLVGYWPETLKQNTIEGVTIQLLVITRKDEHSSGWNWLDQRDVFESADDLISHISRNL